MAIIETLTFKRNQSPYFVVDNTKLSVPLILPSEANLYMINASGNGNFEAGDNFNLLSIGVKVPLSFEFTGADAIVSPATPQKAEVMPLKLQGFWGTNFEYVDRLNGGQLLIPFENYEMSYNNFFDDPSRWKTHFRLFLWPSKFAEYSQENPESPPNISMLTVPDSLNGKTFYITIFCKIEHTYPINAAGVLS